jgi:hypothetical protein
MAKACPFSRGFASRGFELSPEFERQPAHSAPENHCAVAVTDPFRFFNVVVSR